MEIEPVNGSVTKFMHLEKIGDESGSYLTHGAIYHDIEDEDDGLPYYYVSFTMDYSIQILKIRAND